MGNALPMSRKRRQTPPSADRPIHEDLDPAASDRDRPPANIIRAPRTRKRRVDMSEAERIAEDARRAVKRLGTDLDDLRRAGQEITARDLAAQAAAVISKGLARMDEMLSPGRPSAESPTCVAGLAAVATQAYKAATSAQGISGGDQTESALTVDRLREMSTDEIIAAINSGQILAVAPMVLPEPPVDIEAENADTDTSITG